MRFEWDEKKRRANLRKHGIDFVGIEDVFEGITATIEDTRFDYDERRFQTVGLLKGRPVVVAHTEEGDLIRIISVRKAMRHEEESYFEQIVH
ncbi:MAG: BrnT family toxin [Acidobacteriota bacterium]